MATTNYSWNLPIVGGSEDTWGTDLNANWTALDTLLGGTNATEFAILDGATVSTAELNLLDGVTWTLTDYNALTATATELNLLDGVTALTGADNVLVTGTAGTNGQLAQWNADGDVVGYTIPTQDAATWETGTDTTESLVSPAKVKAAFDAHEQQIGVGQTWQDVSGSRADNLTVYQNTTGKPIMVSINFSGDFNSAYFEISANNVTWVRVYSDSGDGAPVPMSGIIVPTGHYYRASRTGGGNDGWFELR